MRTEMFYDQLACALFGKTRRTVMGLLLTRADESFYLREIVRRVSLGQGSVQRELGRLTDAGLLVRRRQGNQVYYQANQNAPIFKELKSILVKTAGMGDILRQALTKIKDRIRVAFIHGSFVRGKDRAASDIDLVIIGDITLGETISHLRSAQEILGREINATVYSASEFQKKLQAKHHFVSTIIHQPKIMLIGEESELTRLGKKRVG